MMMRRPMAFLLSAVLLIAGLVGTAIVAAQTAPAAADRSETVNGWRVEDIANPSEDDPAGRIIRMTREIDGNRVEYEVEISGTGGTGWGHTRFEADTVHDGRGCSKSGGAAAETGPPESRGGRVRVVLARELRDVERDCGSLAGATGPLLDGFEGAFALLSAWHGVRLAEIEAAVAANEATAYENVAYDTDMSMDMNATDMSMDTNMSMETDMTDMNGATDMNSMSQEDYDAAVEAAANALEAAADAAANAALDDPK